MKTKQIFKSFFLVVLSFFTLTGFSQHNDPFKLEISLGDCSGLASIGQDVATHSGAPVTISGTKPATESDDDLSDNAGQSTETCHYYLNYITWTFTLYNGTPLTAIIKTILYSSQVPLNQNFDETRDLLNNPAILPYTGLYRVSIQASFGFYRTYYNLDNNGNRTGNLLYDVNNDNNIIRYTTSFAGNGENECIVQPVPNFSLNQTNFNQTTDVVINTNSLIRGTLYGDYTVVWTRAGSNASQETKHVINPTSHSDFLPSNNSIRYLKPGSYTYKVDIYDNNVLALGTTHTDDAHTQYQVDFNVTESASDLWMRDNVMDDGTQPPQNYTKGNSPLLVYSPDLIVRSWPTFNNYFSGLAQTDRDNFNGQTFSNSPIYDPNSSSSESYIYAIVRNKGQVNSTAFANGGNNFLRIYWNMSSDDRWPLNWTYDLINNGKNSLPFGGELTIDWNMSPFGSGTHQALGLPNILTKTNNLTNQNYELVGPITFNVPNPDDYFKDRSSGLNMNKGQIVYSILARIEERDKFTNYIGDGNAGTNPNWLQKNGMFIDENAPTPVHEANTFTDNTILSNANNKQIGRKIITDLGWYCHNIVTRRTFVAKAFNNNSGNLTTSPSKGAIIIKPANGISNPPNIVYPQPIRLVIKKGASGIKYLDQNIDGLGTYGKVRVILDSILNIKWIAGGSVKEGFTYISEGVYELNADSGYFGNIGFYENEAQFAAIEFVFNNTISTNVKGDAEYYFGTWDSIANDFEGAPAQYIARINGNVEAEENNLGKMNMGYKQLTTNTQNLTIYPNPANDLITIGFLNTENSPTNLVIKDLLGNTIKEIFANKLLQPNNYEYTCQTNNLANGIYMVCLTNEAGLQVCKKIIVAK